jgi:hypothetical protein
MESSAVESAGAASEKPKIETNTRLLRRNKKNVAFDATSSNNEDGKAEVSFFQEWYVSHLPLNLNSFN